MSIFFTQFLRPCTKYQCFFLSISFIFLWLRGYFDLHERVRNMKISNDFRVVSPIGIYGHHIYWWRCRFCDEARQFRLSSSRNPRNNDKWLGASRRHKSCDLPRFKAEATCWDILVNVRDAFGKIGHWPRFIFPNSWKIFDGIRELIWKFRHHEFLRLKRRPQLVFSLCSFGRWRLRPLK